MEIIYNNYFEKLFLTAMLAVKDKFMAEDIASNVLASVFRNAANYGYIKYPNAWMYKSVKYAISNYLERDTKYIFTELIDEIVPANDVKLDLKIDFENSVKKLTKRQQELVQLHYVYGLKIKEIAKFLNISVSTVNRELAEIRENLDFFNKY